MPPPATINFALIESPLQHMLEGHTQKHTNITHHPPHAYH
jgi:hypothetical protein